MSNANGAGRTGHTPAAEGPSISITLIVPHQGTEKDFITAAVREARIHARASWRARTGHVVNKGGRPSLKQAVWEACDVQWALWGGRFPRNRSATIALVEEVSKVLSVSYRGKPCEWKDPRTITDHVNRWTDHLPMANLPKRWFKTPDGKIYVGMMTRASQRLAAYLSAARATSLPPSRTRMLTVAEIQAVLARKGN